MEPRAVWAALRRGWVVVLVAALLGGLAAALVTVVLGPSYSSRLQFFVSTAGSSSASDALQGEQLAQQRVASYTELLTGAELAARVADRVDWAVTPERVASDIRASTVTGTVLIDVTVSDSSRDVARRVSTAVAVEFPRLVAGLETANSDRAPVVVSLTDEPSTPAPSDVLARNATFGLAVGLLVGAAVVVTRAVFDRTVRGRRQVEESTGGRVAGVLFGDRESGVTGAPEQYRQLAVNLQHLAGGPPPEVVVLSSPVPADGVDAVAIHLAEALVESGRSVAVVDADPGRPGLVERLGMVAGAGLADVLAGDAVLGDVLQFSGSHGFTVLGAGRAQADPGRVVAPTRMAGVLDGLLADVDVVLVAAAPLLPFAVSRALAAEADGVLLVAGYGETTETELAEAVSALDAVGAQLLGTVLTHVPAHGELGSVLAPGPAHRGDSPPVGPSPRPARTRGADPVSTSPPRGRRDGAGGPVPAAGPAAVPTTGRRPGGSSNGVARVVATRAGTSAPGDDVGEPTGDARQIGSGPGAGGPAGRDTSGHDARTPAGWPESWLDEPGTRG
ncbi:polysaccharide biosynthesis tyrosine autokinase [Goekera deserti]|uniref:polysaccharide biosynthesis tyrosine autokinase n=1 Tax=Goekera deserti TaxID=2497753 RepID=UPI001390F425|nr:polysaccharide biosynthesis tyrosine autokinase [Goekera deserti]